MIRRWRISGELSILLIDSSRLIVVNNVSLVSRGWMQTQILL